jgi:N-acetylmuramoyl-L-alanine amidase
MPVHIVRAGECLSQIAHRFGFASAKALFDLPDNADLKKRRKSPHVLHPGDRVVIPERPPKEIECATGATHTFKVKVPRRKLRVVLEDQDGTPLDGVAYKLVVGKETFEGETGGDGSIEHDLPIDATDGELELNGHSFPVRIGHLNPMAETDDGGRSGALSRLANLGFHGDPDDAVRAYRRARGLDPDGGLDDALAQKLVKEHGC